MSDPLAVLSEVQRDLLTAWLPGLRVVRDLGWGLVDSSVLEVEAGGDRYVVKADGDANNHVPRELVAHARWLGPWVAEGRAPRLVAGDAEAKILVTAYLEGELVLGSPAQDDPGTFRQAGRLLALLHAQPGHVDATYEAVEDAKVLRNLTKPHRIDAAMHARLEATISAWPTGPVAVVPTHGDWQPRNWLVHEGRVAAIDLGRAALRPAMTDWLRLASRDFRWDPARERAFVEGYGGDPREPEAWWRERVREAVNTAVWAYAVGDEPFEAEGHAMIARVLGAADD
ncbi:phosphotransferase family protein [Nocardioides plantarum]|uniref:Phosphotransferase family protein n=1 Tax=Nocardioides plantarum TaxID=29299 RepID=A0ABV5K5N3_9ACTN|nr:phosphotransferase [Nocardioides plantarum]